MVTGKRRLLIISVLFRLLVLVLYLAILLYLCRVLTNNLGGHYSQFVLICQHQKKQSTHNQLRDEYILLYLEQILAIVHDHNDI